MSPFTGDGLKEIKTRSHGRSELSSRTDRPLHCMHFDHTRNPLYNEANRGLRVTVIEHQAYHMFYRGNEAELGLKPCQNDYAIDMLNRESVAFMHKIGKLDQFDDELADAVLMWEQLLSR